MMLKRLLNLLFLGIVLCACNKSTEETQIGESKNGFELTNTSIPVEEILKGGPAKDGIPSIDQPLFLSQEEASVIDKSERVLGVFYNGVAKAYPINILDWHEIVNDDFGGEKLAITYCPLCGSGATFKAGANGSDLEFGVSGLLYNSDVLLYDRRTESLWSQLLGEAVSGELIGTELVLISTENTLYSNWIKKYPNTLVLSKDTGFDRNYDVSPYGSYGSNEELYFPVSHENDLFPKKTLVLGIEVNGQFKAYPFPLLAEKEGPIKDSFQGTEFELNYDLESQSANITSSNGKVFPSIVLYWFAWYAFHPETAVFE